MAWVQAGEDYGYEWFKCGSKWSGCRGGHGTIAELKACFAWGYRQAAEGDKVWPCTWLVEGRYDDGSIYTYECGALSYATEHGYECEAGHDHIDMQWMAENHLAYASDEDEAKALVKAGVQPLTMAGQVFPL